MTDDDRLMSSLREEPRPEFARGLHDRLRTQGPARRPARAPSRRLTLSFTMAAAAAVVALSFTFPAVRASAQAFLDLFRVRNFAAVSVSQARIDQLKATKLDVQTFFGQRTETPAEHSKPEVFASTAEAGARAGFAVRTPADLEGYLPDTIAVVGGQTVTFVAHTAPLQQLLEGLDIRDLQVPAGLEGQTVRITTTPVVAQQFVRDQRHAVLAQARSPEVALPPGTDVSRLAEIALRIAGLDAGEARNFARSTDWSSTMLIPIPLESSNFTQVTVRGQKGLLVSSREERKPGERHRPGTLLLWGEDGMVYALAGDLGQTQIVQMAESIR
jgi:hypothetical protein